MVVLCDFGLPEELPKTASCVTKSYEALKAPPDRRAFGSMLSVSLGCHNFSAQLTEQISPHDDADDFVSALAPGFRPSLTITCLIAASTTGAAPGLYFHNIIVTCNCFFYDGF